MPDYSKPIDTILYKRDDILYEIEIFTDENNKYYGRWICSKCKENGASTSTNRDKNIVIVANKTNASSHHGSKHL